MASSNWRMGLAACLAITLSAVGCIGTIDSPEYQHNQSQVGTCSECNDVGEFAAGALGDNLCPCGFAGDGGVPDGGVEEPESPPSGWICGDLFYGDGLCDCGCRASDSDCAAGEGCTDVNCRADGCQVCNGRVCTPIAEPYEPQCCVESSDGGVSDGGTCQEEWLCDPVEGCLTHCEVVELFDFSCACPGCLGALECCP